MLRIFTVDARAGAWRGCGGCSWTDDDGCGVYDTIVFVFLTVYADVYTTCEGGGGVRVCGGGGARDERERGYPERTTGMGHYACVE